MRGFALALLVLVLANGVPAQKEPQELPPFAEGGAPDCPDHLGTRTTRSEVVSAFGSIVFISGAARRGPKGCEYSARLEVDRKGKKAAFPLPQPHTSQFSIVDFSCDGQRILLARDVGKDPPDLDYRDDEVATMSLANGEMHWINAWDLFGWGNCDATVEAQGYSGAGRVVLRARPGTWASRQRPDCVKGPGLFATDLTPGSAQKIPDDTKIEPYGKEVHPASEACRTDPDIIGPCFKVHGRLSIWNGTPSQRIWRIGTKRMLGIHNDMPPPESVAAHMQGFDTEIYADFTVCPFTKERPGSMQVVCIESAENIVYKKR